METFSVLLVLREGNPRVTGGFPSQNQWRGALLFSLTSFHSRRWIWKRHLQNGDHFVSQPQYINRPDRVLRWCEMVSLKLFEWPLSRGRPLQMKAPRSGVSKYMYLRDMFGRNVKQFINQWLKGLKRPVSLVQYHCHCHQDYRSSWYSHILLHSALTTVSCEL